MSDKNWEKVGELQGEVYKRQQETTGVGGIIIVILVLVFLGFLADSDNKDKVEQSANQKSATNANTGGIFKEATEATEALGKLLSRLKSFSDVERNEAKLISAIQRVRKARLCLDRVDLNNNEASRDILVKYENRLNTAVKSIQTSSMKRSSDAQQRVNILMWQCDP